MCRAGLFALAEGATYFPFFGFGCKGQRDPAHSVRSLRPGQQQGEAAVGPLPSSSLLSKKLLLSFPHAVLFLAGQFLRLEAGSPLD